MTTIDAKIKQRIDTTANWNATNPVLLSGESGWEVHTDGTLKQKIGNGVATWTALPYVHEVTSGTATLSEWDADRTYLKGEMVTLASRLWVAKTETSARPIDEFADIGVFPDLDKWQFNGTASMADEYVNLMAPASASVGSVVQSANESGSIFRGRIEFDLLAWSSPKVDTLRWFAGLVPPSSAGSTSANFPAGGYGIAGVGFWYGGTNGIDLAAVANGAVSGAEFNYATAGDATTYNRIGFEFVDNGATMTIATYRNDGLIGTRSGIAKPTNLSEWRLAFIGQAGTTTESRLRIRNVTWGMPNPDWDTYAWHATRGYTGLTGPQGPQGPPGLTGPQGPEGPAADLSAYAPLASPTFTGDPKAPTPATTDNDTSVATTAFVKAALLAAHPVGSIYMSTSSTNPGTFLGGTWAAWGSGRVPVGVSTADTEFNTVEKVGGAKTHTLTIEQIPSHNHNGSTGSSSIAPLQGLEAGGSASAGPYARGSGTNSSQTMSGSTHNHSIPAEGGGQEHNNLQPYITCYMFKRTA